MKDGLDFLKVGDYAVINLNCMFPAPEFVCHEVDFSAERDPKYRALMQAEYRIIKRMSDRIEKNARNLYKHKLAHGNATGLSARCNDYKELERLCLAY